MKQYFRNFVRDESGATAIEYGLIVGVMAVVIIAAMALFTPQLKGVFTNVGTTLAAPPNP